MRKNYQEKYDDGYYHIGKDLEDYPDAWCHVVWSRRGPGKTYSGLWYSYGNDIPIIYMKRTIEDVELICANNAYGFDASPYVPINRDKGTNIKPKLIKNGIGGFWECDSEGTPEGTPISYILACNAIKKFKGFDFSQCDWMLFDEFIPQLGERTSAGNKEGELILDLYMTIARDRQKRGKKPLKLILFANAEEISTPITNTLEIVDLMADMNATGETHYYDQERGIHLHHITSAEFPIKESEKIGIYAAMKDTAWGAKSFEGDFANNDFSNVSHIRLKEFKPMIHLMYKNHHYYIYLRQRDGMYFMTESRAKCKFSYDLNKENDQKLFWLEHGIDLRSACISDKMRFKKYTMYDLIINYKKFFNI